MRNHISLWKKQVCLVSALLAAAPGCVGQDDETSSEFASEADDSERDQLEKLSEADLREVTEDELNQLSTGKLARSLSRLSEETLIVFDFDDTLRDHVKVDGENKISKWAEYAEKAVRLSRKGGSHIAVCSSNSNREGLKSSLSAWNTKVFRGTVFNDAFFASPAFQTNAAAGDKTKLDNIRTIMDHFNITEDRHVILFDDDPYNIRKVGCAIGSNIIAIKVPPSGIDEASFRRGLIARYGVGTPPQPACADDNGQCTAEYPCREGQGDCDSDDQCASGLVCAKDQNDGDEVCVKAP